MAVQHGEEKVLGRPDSGLSVSKGGLNYRFHFQTCYEVQVFFSPLLAEAGNTLQWQQEAGRIFQLS